MKPSSLLDKMLISPKNNTVIQTGVWIFHFFLCHLKNVHLWRVKVWPKRFVQKKKKIVFCVVADEHYYLLSLPVNHKVTAAAPRVCSSLTGIQLGKKMKICHVTVKSSFKSNLTEIWISRLSGVTFKSLYSSAEVTPFQITVSVVVCVTCVMYV